MVILRHLHLPGLTTYNCASHLQQILVSRLLKYKALASKAPSTSSSPATTPPHPTILTFTPPPIYTTGRRETAPPSPVQLEYLCQPLDTEEHGVQTAEFAQALRGGQITFHGPGQLVIYPILSLSHPSSFPSSPIPLTPRCYIHLLESCTISTLARYSIPSIRTENPGVWVNEDKKIAALGVHLRRNVTSHGIGLNVHTDLRWFDRIVACGLEGKGVTSMWEENARLRERCVGIEEVAGVWLRCFAKEVGLGEGSVMIVREEVLKGDEAEGMDEG